MPTKNTNASIPLPTLGDRLKFTAAESKLRWEASWNPTPAGHHAREAHQADVRALVESAENMIAPPQEGVSFEKK
jgi:hypothetical protein